MVSCFNLLVIALELVFSLLNGIWCANVAGPPETVFDWTREIDSDLSQSTNNQAFSRKHWRLLQCQNGI